MNLDNKNDIKINEIKNNKDIEINLNINNDMPINNNSEMNIKIENDDNNGNKINIHKNNKIIQNNIENQEKYNIRKLRATHYSEVLYYNNEKLDIYHLILADSVIAGFETQASDST